jgi:vanillate O-demethylase ferredoxin subunit
MRYIDRLDPATVVEVRDLTPSVREIVLETPWTAPHGAGAHIDVELILEGRVETRSYSLVGEGAGPVRRVAVRLDPASRGGSRAMHALKPGARLRVTPPSNSFELALGAPAYFLVAGGIGVTPLVGMAEALVWRGAAVTMLYAGRSRAEMAYLAELEAALGGALTVWADEERGSPPDLAGAFAALPPGGQAYVCGPNPMLEAAKRAWAEAGRPQAELRFETFGSSGAYPSLPFTVHVADLGRDIEVPADRSLLDCLEAAGLEVMSECRRGECGLCVLKVQGCTTPIDHRDVFLSDAQRAAGDRLCACVSRAAGGTLTVESGLRRDKTPEFSKVFAAEA